VRARADHRRQEADQELGDPRGPVLVLQQVLTNFQFYGVQAAREGVVRRGVVLLIHGVRLVVANNQARLGVQQVQQGAAGVGRAIVQHADMPGPGHAAHRRGEAVDRDQCDRPLPPGAQVQFHADSIVVGRMQRVDTVLDVRGAQAVVPGYADAVGGLDDQARVARSSIAVDHQARIPLVHEQGIQTGRQPSRQTEGADIPRDVQVERGVGQAKTAQRRGNRAAPMIADEDEIRAGAWIFDTYGVRVAMRQQDLGRIEGNRGFLPTMAILSIRHWTRYRYRRPVRFGEHQMMVRPREGHDQCVLSEQIDIRPGAAAVRTMGDVFGNTILVADFDRRADELVFESRVKIDHRPANFLARAHEEFPPPGAPFIYGPKDLPDLARCLAPADPDAAGDITRWAARFAPANGRGRVIEALVAMTQAIHEDFTYQTRLFDAPRPASETLGLRTGSCRDFAVLMMEAARRLGLAARFASGYLHAGSSEVGGGHTHAWAQIFLPSCGWMDFDPTNAGVGAARLVRVAVAVEPRQAVPLHGVWFGKADDFLDMQVEVDVRAEREQDTVRSVGIARAG
jgi:transglutaminase-like putative cysteine protease